MDPSDLQKQREPEEPRYVSFPHLPDDAKHSDGTPVLNKYSSTVTRGHDFPGAKAMLYATGINEEQMQTAPHVGIAAIHYQGNPCKSVTHGLSSIRLTFS